MLEEFVNVLRSQNPIMLCTFLLRVVENTAVYIYLLIYKMNQHGLSVRRMRRRGGCFLTPRSRGSAFFVRGRSLNKYFKQALNVRRGGGVNFLTPCTPTIKKITKRHVILMIASEVVSHLPIAAMPY